MTDHRTELLTLIKGSPQPDLSLVEMAAQLGISEPEAEGLLESLVREGRVHREGDRLTVVESAAAPAEPGEEPV